MKDPLEAILQEIYGRLGDLDRVERTGLNRRRQAEIATFDVTTSTSYVALGLGPGPSVEVDVPVSGTVLLGVGAFADGQIAPAAMGVVLSGKNTLAAADTRAAKIVGAQADIFRWRLYEGLTQGLTTFTAVYRSYTGNFVTFADRTIIAIPM